MGDQAIQYRAEIDGLRAIAVLPVILFHAGIAGFGGGFVGVDIFFVISGYLITSILWSDLQRGSFSFKKFYERRARRILPALLFVIICTLAVGWLSLPPDRFENLGKSALAAIFSVSNVYFWKDTGYFEAAAESQPLLHTWSLGVEEQTQNWRRTGDERQQSPLLVRHPSVQAGNQRSNSSKHCQRQSDRLRSGIGTRLDRQTLR